MSLEAELFSLRETLNDVAVGERGWLEGLAGLTTLAGAKAADLIAFGSNPFHVISGVATEELAEFSAARGHDPSVSSRVRVGLTAPTMTLLDEGDFDTEGDRRRSAEYGRVLDLIDIGQAHLAVLDRTSEDVLGLSVLSPARSGPMTSHRRRALAAALPHLLATVRFQAAAEGRSLKVTAAAFEQAGVPAFLLDRGLRLRAVSAQADELLRRGDFRLDAGRLRLRNGADPAFQVAVRQAAFAESIVDAAPRTVRAVAPDGLAYVVEAAPLPRAHDLPFASGVVVVARAPRPAEARAARIAALLYGLTPAEAAVAGLLANGLSAATIAERQGVALGTVRTHLRRLLEKAGARNQVDLVASLASRL